MREILWVSFVACALIAGYVVGITLHKPCPATWYVVSEGD